MNMVNKSPILGDWRIVEMEEWDEDYINEEVKAYVRFDPGGHGEFQFGYVSGDMDCRFLERDGQPVVEWSWMGADTGGGMDEIAGRGWAVLESPNLLRGHIFIHDGDDSDFSAKRKPPKKAKA